MRWRRFRKVSAIRDRLAKAEPENADRQKDLRKSVGNIDSMAYSFVLAHDFTKALEAADESIAFAPDLTWLHTNRAHALTFLGRTDEARALYLKHRGAANVVDEKPGKR